MPIEGVIEKNHVYLHFINGPTCWISHEFLCHAPCRVEKLQHVREKMWIKPEVQRATGIQKKRSIQETDTIHHVVTSQCALAIDWLEQEGEWPLQQGSTHTNHAQVLNPISEHQAIMFEHLRILVVMWEGYQHKARFEEMMKTRQMLFIDSLESDWSLPVLLMATLILLESILKQHIRGDSAHQDNCYIHASIDRCGTPKSMGNNGGNLWVQNGGVQFRCFHLWEKEVALYLPFKILPTVQRLIGSVILVLDCSAVRKQKKGEQNRDQDEQE